MKPYYVCADCGSDRVSMVCPGGVPAGITYPVNIHRHRGAIPSEVKRPIKRLSPKQLAAKAARYLTRQMACKPYESGRNVLPGMEPFAQERRV